MPTIGLGRTTGMAESELSDEQLVERIRAAPGGAPAAFEILVRRHQGKVHANCRYLSRSPNDVEDLAQEVFTKAYFGLRRFEGRSKFSTWLKRIKANHCLNFLAKVRGKVFVDVEDPAVVQSQDLATPPRAPKELERRDKRERITEALDSLSDSLRVALVLRDVDGLSYQDIAEDLGIGLSAVKMRIKRAREEFRSLYRDTEIADEATSASAAAGSSSHD